MWFVSLVPGLLSAVWIWPRLRVPRFWLTASVVMFLATTVWLGLDIQKFLDRGGSSSKAGVRLLYKLFRETDRPVIPIATGCLVAGLFSLRKRSATSGNKARTEEHPSTKAD